MENKLRLETKEKCDQPISMKVSASTLAYIDGIAKSEGCSRSEAIKSIIRFYKRYIDTQREESEK